MSRTGPSDHRRGRPGRIVLLGGALMVLCLVGVAVVRALGIPTAADVVAYTLLVVLGLVGALLALRDLR